MSQSHRMHLFSNNQNENSPECIKRKISGLVQVITKSQLDSRIVANSLAAILGTSGSIQSTADTGMLVEPSVEESCMYLTPIIYSLMGYFSENVNYSSMLDNSLGTVTIRVVDWSVENSRSNYSTFGAPLYAMNLAPINFHGMWKDIDFTLPSSAAPTFELLGIDPNQKICLNNREFYLGEIDFRIHKVYEATRLGSIAEVVFAKKITNKLGGDSRIKKVLEFAQTYGHDQSDFLNKLMVGRALFGIGLATFIQSMKVDLLIGNFSAGAVDKFAASLVGKDIKQTPIQKLKRVGYHVSSSSYLDFKPYFNTHDVFPFCIDAQAFACDMLNYNSNLLGSLN